MRIAVLNFILLFSFNLQAEQSGLADLRFEVEKYQLENGLTVLLHQDRSVPLISYHTWFKVGSKDEEPGYTGIAHLFEHMMFKGTEKYSNKDYERIIRQNGASNNAFTSRDYTGYYVNAPSSKLEQIMDLESDRVVNLKLDEAMLQSEREVVKEERRFRVENRIMGLLMERINSVLYKIHPYKWPIIGYMKDLDNITVQKAEEFYRTYYAPNNAVLVIAGDFDKSKVKKLISKYYGHMKSQEIKRTERKPEPLQTTARKETFYRDIQNDYFSVSYVVPRASSPEVFPLEIAANILGSGTSSRLHQKLVYELQVATSVFAYVMTHQDSSALQIVVSLKPEKNKAKAQTNLNRVQKVVADSIADLRVKEVGPKEISKAQNRIAKSFVDALKTVNGKAYSLAANETVVGSYEKLFTDLDNYMSVKPADIKSSAQKYLKPSQSNTVIARPR